MLPVALALGALIALVATYDSPVVKLGNGSLEHLQRAVDELERDTSKTAREVDALIEGICRTYPEFRDEEVCVERDSSR